MKILIIEDDKSLSKSINDYLKMEGHICENAQNFSQAIMKTADNRYDCIILDIGLPDGSGLDGPNGPYNTGLGDGPVGPAPNSGDGVPDGSGF